jgi:HEAT repeat protein
MLWWTLRQIRSEDYETRVEAVRKLGQLRDKRAVEPLVAALQDRAWKVRLEAAAALERLDWQPSDDTQRALLAVACLDFEKAKRFGVSAIEPLMTALQDVSSEGPKAEDLAACSPPGLHFGLRSAAAWALIRIGNASVPRLVDTLRHGDWRVRSKAAEALGMIGSTRGLLRKQGDGRAVEPLICGYYARA